MEEQAQSPADIMAAFEGQDDERRIEDFPAEIREDVEGLLWLGYLEDEFDFCGHSFVIRTLRGDEELLAALVTKDFAETMGQARAWAWAQISLSLVAVDGDPDFCPPTGPDKRAYARARFRYTTSKWYWPVAEHLYGRYAALLNRQTEAVKRVENLSKESLPTFAPSVASSIEKDDSQEPQEDIREFLDDQGSADSN